MPATHLTIYPLLLALCLLVAGCANPVSDPESDCRSYVRLGTKDLAQKREQWDSSRPSQYRLIYTRMSFHVPKVYEVVFQDDEIQSAGVQNGLFDEHRGFAPIEDVSADEIHTVDTLFDLIQSLDREEGQLIDMLTVEYDESMGYPTQISVDPLYIRCKNGSCMGSVDEEFSYVVKVVEMDDSIGTLEWSPILPYRPTCGLPGAPP